MKTHCQLLILLFLVLPTALQAQSGLWYTLSKVEWQYKFSETYGQDIGYPSFSPEVKDLNGKEVTIKGFYMPVETEDESAIFSAFPYANCFFCGGAGIESVLAVFMKKPQKFDLDQQVMFKGKLELNDGETGLIYNLRDAVIVNDNAGK